MSQEQPTAEEQLLFQLVSSYATGAWVGLGKMNNPVTGEAQPNLEQARFSIDMLDMLQQRVSDMAEWESAYLSKTLNDLRTNYITAIEQDSDNGAAPADSPPENSN